MSIARILVVDDDGDTRELLELALTTRGYDVEHAANADEALAKLQGSRFDLVLTDYDMPGRTGAALLAEAQRKGLLDSTPALMLTAHPTPETAPGVDVVTKPFDLDKLIQQLAKVLKADGADPEPSSRSGPDILDLVLYVGKQSPPSDLARQNLNRVLKLFQPASLRITFRDPAQEPEQAERDRVVFTPTLVKRAPQPRTWILGDLSDPSVLVDLLECNGCQRVS
jgi:CheY-like chemotaxis protein